MKYGRDMGQFIYGLHAAFPLREYISHELFDVLDRATESNESDSEGNIINTHRLFAGIEIDGKPSPIGKRDTLPHKIQFNEGLYTFLDKKYVDVPGCRPKTLLQTLAKYAKRYKDCFVPVLHVNTCLPKW